MTLKKEKGGERDIGGLTPFSLCARPCIKE